MKADSSRAIAVTITVRRLPFRSSERKRPHNLVCAFHAISRASRCGLHLWLLVSAYARRISIAPGRLHNNTSRPPIPGFGDAASLDLVASRVFRGHQTQIAHQLARILKAGEITDLGQHPHSRNEINSPHRLQGRDNLGKRPLGYYLAYGIFQTLHSLTFLAYPLK
jgi:hypothetical protein